MSAQERELNHADLAELLDFLQETPNKISKLTEGLSDPELRVSDDDGRFSTVENICHLRDLELHGYAPRISRMLDEENPALPDFDGVRVAALSDYNNQDKDEALQTFATARRANVKTLKSLSKEQLGRTGVLEGVGQITLLRLAEMMREHDEGHLEDLRLLVKNG